LRLRTLLILGIAAAAIPPLLLMGIAATHVATEAVTERVEDLHAQKADNLATFVDTWITGRVHAISLLAGAFPLAELSDSGRVGLQRLVYSQFNEINIVSLVNRAGADLSPSQMARTAFGDTVQPGHQAISNKRFHSFREQLPLATLRQQDIAVGRPYFPDSAAFPVVPIVFAAGGEDGPILAVELSLEPLVLQLEEQVSEATEVAMLDGTGTCFARQGEDLVRAEHFSFFLGGVAAADLKYQLEGGEEVLAAFSRVDSTGWLAVVAEPLAHAAAPGRDIRWQSAYFGLVAVCLAAVMGFHFARKLHRPVVQLRDAAQEVGEGRLGRVVVPDRVRELGDLGQTFNTMSQHLKEHEDKINAQQEEIRTWNKQLQRRVEDRTRELREAQAELVESGKLAAVAELGAGLAHELNNPLAGILGVTQILRQRRAGESDEPLIASMEEQVVRCTEIVRTLLSFTREGIDRGELDIVELDHVMAEVVVLVTPAFRQRGSALRHRPASEQLPVRADRARLGRALAQLLTSMRALLPAEGALHVHGKLEREEIVVELVMEAERPPGRAAAQDPAGKDDWFASGMSLWVARRILAEHGGQLREPEPPGVPHYRLVLPKA